MQRCVLPQSSVTPASARVRVHPSQRAPVAAAQAPRQAPSHARVVARRVAVSATGDGAAAAAPSSVNVTLVKSFLEELKSLGDIRLITNDGCAVLESVTTFDGLFYAQVPNKGEYANLIKAKENIDFHLLVDKVSKATLESAPGRGDYTSHIIRLHNLAGTVSVSLYVMWPADAPRGKYAPGQVEAFQALVARHGAELNFLV